MGNIYTKGGDQGETSLIGGIRVPKSDQRVSLYGEVDELNSHLGLALSFLNGRENEFQGEINLLIEIQELLINVGSLLACEQEKRADYKLDVFDDSLIKKIEDRVDILDSSMPELTAFIIPGGKIESAQLHVCRTVCRRVERSAVRFEQTNKGDIPREVFALLNRLSDYLFVLSRKVN